MNQAAIFTVAGVVFIPAITAWCFLVMKAPKIHEGLEARAKQACAILALAGGDLLRDLRGQLNQTLLPHDTGEDPYMTRIDFSLPTPLLRRYKQIAKVERAAKNAPLRLQRRVMRSAWVAGALTVCLVLSGVLAGCKDWIGIAPAQWAIAVAGVFLLGALAYAVWFARPYRVVHRAELLASAEALTRPSVSNAARTLGFGGVESSAKAVDETW